MSADDVKLGISATSSDKAKMVAAFLKAEASDPAETLRKIAGMKAALADLDARVTKVEASRDLDAQYVPRWRRK